MSRSAKIKQPLDRGSADGPGPAVAGGTCPVPAGQPTSLRDNLCHVSEYHFTDTGGRSQSARVVVHSPEGLSSGDEFYLWGLLALTLAQPEPGLSSRPHPTSACASWD